jgi:hypothetical protein
LYKNLAEIGQTASYLFTIYAKISAQRHPNLAIFTTIRYEFSGQSHDERRNKSAKRSLEANSFATFSG